MTYKYFISYSTTSSMFADNVCSHLDDNNLSYFRDVKEIKWGEEIKDEVETNILNSFAVIVLIDSETLQESDWVPYEIGYATALGKPILCLLSKKTIPLPDYMKRYKYLDNLKDFIHYIKDPDNILKIASKKSIVQREKFKLETLYLNWWEVQNQKRSENKTISFNNYKFVVDKQVFSPSVRQTYSTYLALDFIPNNLRGKRVLDMGTGCGILAVIAVKQGAKEVVAIDTDPNALSNARKNVANHRCGNKIKILEGDIYKTEDKTNLKQFDYIFGNLPIAFRSAFWIKQGSYFSTKIEEFISGFEKHLKSNGTAYMTWASFGDENLIKKLSKKYGLSVKEYSTETFGITWLIYEFKITKHKKPK